MELEKLKSEYEDLLSNYDEVKATDFVDSLVATNNLEIIGFHYNLLKNNENDHLFYEIRADFDKHGEDGKKFLLNKLDTENYPSLKAEALFILGSMDDLEPSEIEKIVSTAKEFIKDKDNSKNQYHGIIVLGWLGGKEEIISLENELNNNNNPELRDHAASALRQIWFNHPRLVKRILKIYDEKLKNETNDEVNRTIIACVQDMLRKKFGIKESQYGEISGDVSIAKPKAIKALEKELI